MFLFGRLAMPLQDMEFRHATVLFRVLGGCRVKDVEEEVRNEEGVEL